MTARRSPRRRDLHAAPAPVDVVVAARPDGDGRWCTHLRHRDVEVEPCRAHPSRGDAWADAWARSKLVAPCLLVLHRGDGSLIGVWSVESDGATVAIAHDVLGPS